MNNIIPRGAASFEQVHDMIEAGRILMLAGSEAMLARLPQGHWIGGSVVEFLVDGIVVPAGERLLYADLTDITTEVTIRHFRLGELSQISTHYPEHGFAAIIAPYNPSFLPHMNEILVTDNRIYSMPLVGWVSAVALSEQDGATAKCFAGGPDGWTDETAVMFVTLQEDLYAHMQIVNPYTPRQGAEIQFPKLSHIQTDCLVDGVPHNFAEYLAALKADIGLPLLADWDGAQVNASILSANVRTGETRFLQSVCPRLNYRLTKGEADIKDAFLQMEEQSKAGNITALSVCAVDMLHVENGQLPLVTAPITFGQIAYAVLNQVLSCICIEPFDTGDE